MSNIVSKSRGGVQDLLLGKGAVNQDRAGGVYSIDRLDIAVAVDSIGEMQALDTTEFTRANVYSTPTEFTTYVYDSARITGISSDASNGTWYSVSVSGVVGGTTAQRSPTPELFQSYFDSTLNKPIWYNGTVWVDATGATV